MRAARLDSPREVQAGFRADGGVELVFVCALPGTNLDRAKRRFAEVAIKLAEKNPRASMSIGLAELADRDTLEELTARADAALSAGRGGARGQAAPQTTRRFTTESLQRKVC